MPNQRYTDHAKIRKLLRRRYYSALSFAKATGSTKLTSRISELRKNGEIFKVRIVTPKSGRKFNEYKYLGKAA